MKSKCDRMDLDEVSKKEKTHLPEIFYEPDNSLKNGYFAMFAEITREIKNSRWLIIQLFKRDLLATYKQSFIGIFWVLILPLVSVLTFIILNHSGIFTVGQLDVPYPLFAVWGLTFWQTFSTGLLAASNSLVKAGAMVVKINFSKKALVIASACQALIPLAVLTTLSFLLCLVYGFLPTMWIILIPILALPLLILLLGLGLILALLNGIIRDIGNILAMLITFLLFLTPILYPLPKGGGLARISQLNPLYYLINLPRDLILFGKSPHWTGFIWSSFAALLAFLLCLAAFHLTETRVAERI
ncbi:MAG: ABC transporter permease [Chrysiogenia bacterium]